MRKELGDSIIIIIIINTLNKDNINYNNDIVITIIVNIVILIMCATLPICLLGYIVMYNYVLLSIMVNCTENMESLSNENHVPLATTCSIVVTSHRKTYTNDFPCLTGIPCGSRVIPARF